jgi:phosphoribosylpyrophosphate synthetase
MFVTNTIPFPKGLPRKIRCVSVAPLFAKAIEAIAGAKSISSLFQ